MHFSENFKNLRDNFSMTLSKVNAFSKFNKQKDYGFSFRNEQFPNSNYHLIKDYPDVILMKNSVDDKKVL